ncbi:hypothetical protein DFJ74DRAFT_319526 [Hyaloraphidium curvatum]|nr:hypothetical protein DFJ74DRAFT_319526 [Hyaloraphidium curvatum]
MQNASPTERNASRRRRLQRYTAPRSPPRLETTKAPAQAFWIVWNQSWRPRRAGRRRTADPAGSRMGSVPGEGRQSPLRGELSKEQGPQATARSSHGWFGLNLYVRLYQCPSVLFWRKLVSVCEDTPLRRTGQSVRWTRWWGPTTKRESLSPAARRAFPFQPAHVTCWPASASQTRSPRSPHRRSTRSPGCLPGERGERACDGDELLDRHRRDGQHVTGWGRLQLPRVGYA